MLQCSCVLFCNAAQYHVRVVSQSKLISGEDNENESFQSVLHQASHVRTQNQHWIHCLKVAGLLLQQLPSARLHTTGAGQFGCIEDLWPQLIMPGLGHAVAAVR
jgi:hypothetical protein